jgi:hypothetical protein
MHGTSYLTTVVNTHNRKKYVVSTVPIPPGDGWQTAVFRPIFGPIANFRKPKLFLGGAAADRAAYQHERAVAIARDINPANWEEASRILFQQVIEERTAAEEAEDAEWLAALRGRFH